MIETIGGKKYEPRKKKGLTTRTHSQMVAQDTVRVEAESPGDFDVRFVGDGWSRRSAGSYSGGSVMAGEKAGDYVEVSFYGTGISWIGNRQGAGGAVDVYVDGDYKGIVSTQGEATSQFTFYSISGLDSGHHTFKAVLRDSRRVDFDCFDIVGSSVVTIECQ